MTTKTSVRVEPNLCRKRRNLGTVAFPATAGTKVMTRESFFDAATFGALVTAAFFVRNATVIFALAAFTLVALAN